MNSESPRNNFQVSFQHNNNFTTQLQYNEKIKASVNNSNYQQISNCFDIQNEQIILFENQIYQPFDDYSVIQNSIQQQNHIFEYQNFIPQNESQNTNSCSNIFNMEQIDDDRYNKYDQEEVNITNKRDNNIEQIHNNYELNQNINNLQQQNNNQYFSEFKSQYQNQSHSDELYFNDQYDFQQKNYDQQSYEEFLNKYSEMETQSHLENIFDESIPYNMQDIILFVQEDKLNQIAMLEQTKEKNNYQSIFQYKSISEQQKQRGIYNKKNQQNPTYETEDFIINNDSTQEKSQSFMNPDSFQENENEKFENNNLLSQQPQQLNKENSYLTDNQSKKINCIRIDNYESSQITTAHVPTNIMNLLIPYLLKFFYHNQITCKFNKGSNCLLQRSCQCQNCLDYQFLKKLKSGKKNKNLNHFKRICDNKQLKYITEDYLLYQCIGDFMAKKIQKNTNLKHRYSALQLIHKFIEGVRNHENFVKLL